MLNLLVISDSPRALFVKCALQSVLKIVIDVVTDFDHGLKDVFEKRPSIVCIQDEIGGVTGESVARHIQMLLGNRAPAFILLHTGISSMREIKGLYEHIVDVGQPDDRLAEELITTLKALLGEQWGKLFIPPAVTPKPDGASAAGVRKTPVTGATVAEVLCSDLERDALLPVGDSSHEASAPAAEEQSSVPTVPLQDSGELAAENGPEQISTARDMMVEFYCEEAEKADRLAQSPAGISRSKASPAAAGTAVPSPAADFRISQSGAESCDEPASRELLLSGEKYDLSGSRLLRRTLLAVLVCGVCTVGGWYLFTRNPQRLPALKQRSDSGSGAKQAGAPASPPTHIPPPLSTPRQAAASSLPSFIPKEGHDKAYAAGHPGWERYVGKDAEFRIFSDTGRVCAVQVLAKDAFLSELLIKSVALECSGSDNYQILSRTTTAGVQIESGTIENSGEIKIYRKSGRVKAFVVSVK